MTSAKDTRERILEAGAEVITAKGFNGCGLSEILKVAGVPKGSFYHHFASKEELGVALIERTRDAYQEWTKDILGDRRMSPLARLRALFERGREECLANGAANECLIAKMALETAKLSDPVHAAVRCAYQQWTAVLAQALREAEAAGEIEIARDADALANVLVMLWEGAALRTEIERSPEPLDICLDHVFGVLLRPAT